MEKNIYILKSIIHSGKTSENYLFCARDFWEPWSAGIENEVGFCYFFCKWKIASLLNWPCQLLWFDNYNMCLQDTVLVCVHGNRTLAKLNFDCPWRELEFNFLWVRNSHWESSRKEPDQGWKIKWNTRRWLHPTKI